MVSADSLQRARYKTEKIPLTFRDFKTYADRQRRFSSHIDGLFTNYESGELTISNNSQNERIIAMSEYYRKNYETTIETLKKDLILHESVHILSDLINTLAKEQ